MALNDVGAVGRIRAPDIVLTGPRGVGKTATLTEFGKLSADQGWEVVNLQAVVGNASLIDSLLRRARARIDAGSSAWKRAFGRVASVNLTIAGTGGGIATHGRDIGRDSALSAEDVADALAALASGVADESASAGVLVTVDEMQAAAGLDLALIAAALQRLNVEHPTAAVLFAGTGLPHTLEVLARAGVTHADRLFDLRTVPLLLDPDDARYAIVEPARTRHVTWQPEAADLIVDASNRYPAHLQLFAHHAWTAAAGHDRITWADAEAAVRDAHSEIERRSLGPRFDQISDRRREFLTALALQGGSCSTSSLARALGRSQKKLSSVRDKLIREGDVYAPRRGELALTVPLFADYLLANYEEASARSTGKALMPLEDMRRNLEVG